MEQPNGLVDRAYWLAWQMKGSTGRSSYDMAVKLMMQGIPEDMALRVAEEVTERRARRYVDSRDDLFYFGLFLVGIGGLLLVSMLLLSNMNAMMALPSTIVLGSIITCVGLMRSRRVKAH